MTASQPFGARVSAAVGNWPPALLTRTLAGPSARLDRVDERADLLELADVAGRRVDRAAARRERPARGLELLRACRPQMATFAPELAERPRDGEADAAAAAGDDGDVAVEETGSEDARHLPDISRPKRPGSRHATRC